ncbi:MAG: hypothetical protein AAFR37_20025, partial [Cyanobacteria bacterium J06628_3]
HDAYCVVLKRLVLYRNFRAVFNSLQKEVPHFNDGMNFWQYLTVHLDMLPTIIYDDNRSKLNKVKDNSFLSKGQNLSQFRTGYHPSSTLWLRSMVVELRPE